MGQAQRISGQADGLRGVWEVRTLQQLRSDFSVRFQTRGHQQCRRVCGEAWSWPGASEQLLPDLPRPESHMFGKRSERKYFRFYGLHLPREPSLLSPALAYSLALVWFGPSMSTSLLLHHKESRTSRSSHLCPAPVQHPQVCLPHWPRQPLPPRHWGVSWRALQVPFTAGFPKEQHYHLFPQSSQARLLVAAPPMAALSLIQIHSTRIKLQHLSALREAWRKKGEYDSWMLWEKQPEASPCLLLIVVFGSFKLDWLSIWLDLNRPSCYLFSICHIFHLFLFSPTLLYIYIFFLIQYFWILYFFSTVELLAILRFFSGCSRICKKRL